LPFAVTLVTNSGPESRAITVYRKNAFESGASSQQALQGERGVLRIPGDFLLRLRHNPFYDYLERRVLDWVAR
jgi:hypothetical protein